MVPNLHMKTFFNFLIFLIFLIFRPARLPAWPASQPASQGGHMQIWYHIAESSSLASWRARFGYMVPNLHMNWPDSAIWYQICIWRGQIRLYGTKFAYEDVFHFFDFFDFQTRQTSSLASQPASQPARVAICKFGTI